MYNVLSRVVFTLNWFAFEGVNEKTSNDGARLYA